MNKERRRLGGIYSELDTAFATVQAAKLQHDLGYEDAQTVARKCVTATAASIDKRLSEASYTPAEIHLVKARVQALIGAAARVPVAGAAATHERQAAKAAALSGK